MKGDRNDDARFTTFFDLYGLPTDFPDYEKARNLSDPYDRVNVLEELSAVVPFVDEPQE